MVLDVLDTWAEVEAYVSVNVNDEYQHILLALIRQYGQAEHDAGYNDHVLE